MGAWASWRANHGEFAIPIHAKFLSKISSVQLKLQGQNSNSESSPKPAGDALCKFASTGPQPRACISASSQCPRVLASSAPTANLRRDPANASQNCAAAYAASTFSGFPLYARTPRAWPRRCNANTRRLAGSRKAIQANFPWPVWAVTPPNTSAELPAPSAPAAPNAPCRLYRYNLGTRFQNEYPTLSARTSPKPAAQPNTSLRSWPCRGSLRPSWRRAWPAANPPHPCLKIAAGCSVSSATQSSPRDPPQ